jgi:hypothetical protein
VHLHWGRPASRFLLSREPFTNLEGGVRAGKTFALVRKYLGLAQDYPGICLALTRWTQDGLDAQLRPAWRLALEQAGLSDLVEWRTDEECDVFPAVDGLASRVYLRALKSSEDSQRYSKLAGLTLARIGIDQAEEVPEDVYRHYVPARLSQKGYPLGVDITPNPPGEDHWIAHDWPEDNSRPMHVYIHTTLYDNAINLGDEVIALQEAGYPPGTTEHRRLILGKRGLSVAGKPIFGGHFDATRHVDPTLRFNPMLMLTESWDFGSRHPCVVWKQWNLWGGLDVLGGVMGQDLELEDFIPIVEEYRDAWFPGRAEGLLQHTCDPAGEIRNSQGSRTAVSILNDCGIYPVIKSDANHPPVKDGAIKTVVGYLKHTAGDGSPLFRLNPRFMLVTAKGRRSLPVLQTALEGGYTYDPKRNYQGTTYPHLRPPFKDGFYEHPSDTLLYGVTAFAPSEPFAQAGIVRSPHSIRRAQRLLREQGHAADDDRQVRAMAREIMEAVAKQERERAERAALKRAQRDTDPMDRAVAFQRSASSFGRSSRLSGRGGW